MMMVEIEANCQDETMIDDGVEAKAEHEQETFYTHFVVIYTGIWW